MMSKPTNILTHSKFNILSFPVTYLDKELANPNRVGVFPTFDSVIFISSFKAMPLNI